MKRDLQQIVLRWPAKVRREIRAWLQGAVTGHGGRLRAAAARHWRAFTRRLE